MVTKRITAMRDKDFRRLARQSSSCKKNFVPECYSNVSVAMCQSYGKQPYFQKSNLKGNGGCNFLIESISGS